MNRNCPLLFLVPCLSCFFFWVCHQQNINKMPPMHKNFFFIFHKIFPWWKWFRFFVCLFVINSLTAKDNLRVVHRIVCVFVCHSFWALLYNHELTMHDYRIIVTGCCCTVLFACFSFIFTWRITRHIAKKDLICNHFFYVSYSRFFLLFGK